MIAPGDLRSPLWMLYLVESIGSVGSNLLMLGVFFYMKHRFGWGLKQSFLLAAGQGSVYIIGALLASSVARRFSRRGSLVALYAGMAAIPAVALFANSAGPIVALLLLYTIVCATNWPVLESLICSDCDAKTLSHRTGTYNLLWSSTGALTIALNGAIIEHWRMGVFLIPLTVHLASAALMAFVTRSAIRNPQSAIPPDRNSQIPLTPQSAIRNPQSPPSLLHQRTLALWLSRISLPATYVVIYSLMAMMPSLPIMRQLTTTQQTILGSAWLIARTGAFILLGATLWWHTRPRILLAAAVLMLIAFLGVTGRPLGFVGPAMSVQIIWMLAWQIALGIALGVIYSGSLYFGMVLSEGSTEHGGYHEGLIGLGQTLGPAAGFMTQCFWPGSLRAGVAAVGAVVALTVLAAGAAAVVSPRSSRRNCRGPGAEDDAGR